MQAVSCSLQQHISVADRQHCGKSRYQFTPETRGGSWGTKNPLNYKRSNCSQSWNLLFRVLPCQVLCCVSFSSTFCMRQNARSDVWVLKKFRVWCPEVLYARQHASYGDCLKVKREYYQNCFVLGCVTMFTVSSTLMWAVLTDPADWVCHIGTLTPCIEAVA